MGLLDDLNPELVFYYFEELTKLPHGSGNTRAVAKYLMTFAQERNMKYRVDEAGNVVIFADGSKGYEDAEPVILQGHIDMVAVKSAESTHDFSNDPLTLAIDGDEIYAEGTSLGGDDGIGIAYMLAAIDDPAVAHPPLDCIFTTDEEVGMLGAGAFDASDIRGHLMINLDSEEEGVFTCGCAGGARVDTILPIRRSRIKGLPVVVFIDGLKGGHSGSMIKSGRASANKLMGRFLYGLDQKVAFSLEKVAGGEKDNAIAVSAKAHLVIDEEDYSAVEAFAAAFEKEIRFEMAGTDEGVSVHVSKGDVHRISVIEPEEQEKIVFLLMHAPYGVRQMSGLMKNVVQTSSNPGIVRTTDTEFVCANLVRSSVASGKNSLIDEIRSLADKCGAHVKISGDYAEWVFRKESPLREKMVAVYKDMFGSEPVINVVHGGVECGIFAKKINHFDAVSIGPNMKDIHTYNERLSISSSRRVWEYLVKLLAELK